MYVRSNNYEKLSYIKKTRSIGLILTLYYSVLYRIN